MKYYIIAGEASGDLHGANLIKHLKKTDEQAEIRCWGGELMESQGADLFRHYKETAYMGALAVLMNLSKIRRNFRDCHADILSFRPDVLILIDYPGFNLRIAEFAHKNNIKVFYYISPKVWAWKKSRVKKIKRYVDKMFSILPFEVGFYNQFNYDVEFCGNPVCDAIHDALEKPSDKESFFHKYELDNKPVIALLAGSRKHEIDLLLPYMLEMSAFFPGYQFVIAGAPSIDADYYKQLSKGFDVKLVTNNTYELLRYAHAAVVTSGTATLETALMKVPQLVCYKFDDLSYAIFSPFIKLKVKYFSLVNLIMDEPVVKELLQKNLKARIKDELQSILFDEPYRTRMLEKYDQLEQKIGGPGASERTASKMVEILKNE